MQNLFFRKNRSMRLKMGKFSKHPKSYAQENEKSPIDEKGLFKAFKAFSEFQLYTRKELYARDGIIVIHLIFLASHIVNQGKSRNLVIYLVVRAKA